MFGFFVRSRSQVYKPILLSFCILLLGNSPSVECQASKPTMSEQASQQKLVTYQLSLRPSTWGIGISFKKGDTVIFQNTAALRTAHQWAPGFEMKNRIIVIKDQNNVLQLYLHKKGQISITKMDMQNPLELTIEGPAVIDASASVMVCHDDFKLVARQAHLRSNEETAWEIKGRAHFNLAGGTLELLNSIKADQDIYVEAAQFLLPYGKVKRIHGRAFDVSYRDKCGEEQLGTCSEYRDKRKNAPIIMQSRYGSLHLSIDKGTIDGSLLMAQGDVEINYKTSLDVLAYCNDNAQCELYEEDIGFFIFSDYVDRAVRKHYAQCDAAVVSAGNNIILHHDGKTCVLDGKNKLCTLSRLTMTGKLEANTNVHISSSTGWAACKNGLPRSHYGPVKQPTPRATFISFKKYLEHNGAAKARACGRFLFVHPLNAHEEELRPLNEFAFYTDNTQALTGHEKVLFSPYLQAQALGQLLQQETQSPNMPDYRNNDLLSLLNQLHDNGYLYALSVGTLTRVQGDGIPGSHTEEPIGKLTQEEKNEYTAFIKTASKRITPCQFKERLCKIKAGTHILTLTKKQLEQAPFSLIFYQVVKEKGVAQIIPVLYLTKSDVAKNYQLGTISGKQVIIENMAKVTNTGLIHAIDKLKIEARTIINEKTAHRHYSITTPLANGEMIGFDVEIIVPKDAYNSANAGIYNRAGTIFGIQKVTLRAESGDIENSALPLGSHTVHWDTDMLSQLFGHENSSTVIDYHPGRIISQGEMNIVAQAGHFLNEASRLIAQGDIHIKGYAGAVFKSLASHHLAYSGARLHGTSVQQIKQEAAQIHRSHVHTNGNIFIESDNGAIHDTAGSYKGNGITFKAPQGTYYEALPIETTTKETRTGSGLFGFEHVQNTIRSTRYAQTTFENSGTLTFDSGLDNVFQAVIFNKGQPIHVVAARNNVFKGAQEITQINTDGWSFGVSFLGSQSFADLAHEDIAGATWHLIDEDPLLVALHNLKDAQANADRAAGATYSSIEALKLFFAYEEQAKSSTHPFARVMGQRLGLTDAQGRFKPRMLWRLGTVKSREQSTHTLKTIIDGSEVLLESGKQLMMLDGTELHTQKAVIKADSMLSQPARDTRTYEAVNAGIIFGSDGSVGFDVSTTQSKETRYDNAHIDANVLEIALASDAELNGTTVDAEAAKLDIRGDLSITSVADTATSHKVGGSVFFGTGGVSGSFAQDVSSKKKVVKTAGFNVGKDSTIKVGNNVSLNGAYISSDNPEGLLLEFENLDHADIDEHSDSYGFTIGSTASTQGSDILGIGGILDVAYRSKAQKGVTRATISQNISLATLASSIDNLNRDMRKLQESFAAQERTVRFVAPVIDPQKTAQRLSEIKELFSRKNTKANFDTLAQKIEEAAQEQDESDSADQWSVAQEIKQQLVIEYLNKKVAEGQVLTPAEVELLEHLTVESNPERAAELLKEFDDHLDATHQQSDEYSREQSPAHSGNDDEDSETIDLGDLDKSANNEPTETVSISQEILAAIEPEPDLSYDTYEFGTQSGETVGVEIITGDEPGTNEQSTSDGMHDFHTISVDGKTTHIKIDGSEQARKELEDSIRAFAASQGSNEVEAPAAWRTFVSIGLDFVPFVGTSKSVAELGLGHDYVAGSEIGNGQRAFIGLTLVFPFVKHLKTVRLVTAPFKIAAKKAGAFIAKLGNKACARLVGLVATNAARPGFLLINAKSVKRAPKAVQKAGREIVLEKVQTFEQARNKALEILGDLGHNAQPNIGKMGVGTSKVVGRRCVNNQARWRLDYDPKKGPHINVEDYRPGKNFKMAIPFEGNEKTIESLLKHLNG